MMKSWLRIASVIWLVSWPMVTAAATITVKVDHDPVRIDESFSVTFVADSRVDDKPDFTPLEQDFELLGTTQSSSFSMHNTEISRERSWTVRLMARRTGEIEIPAIHFGRDQSSPTRVRVLQAPGMQGERDGEIFVEMTAESTSPYVQSQVLLQVRLYRAVNTTGSSLTDPEASDGSAVVEPLDDRTFETWRGGRRFVVLERRYALFPQQSGELQIEPVVFRGDVTQRRRTVFIDPYGNPHYDSGGPTSRTVVRRSSPLTLKVRPAPVAGNWLPATRARLEESWSEDPPQFEVGKPITRTLILTTTRQAASLLPDIQGELPDAFRVYTDRVETDNEVADHGITGRRTERYALMPREPGEFILPAIEVQWFNTDSGEVETLTVAERTVEVKPAAVVAAPDPSPIAPVPIDTAAPMRVDTDSSDRRNLWIAVSLLLAIGWILSLGWLWRRRSRTESSASSPAITSSDSLRALRLACARNDAAAARAALLSWLQAQYGDDGKQSLLDLAGKHDAAVRDAVLELDHVLYGPQPSQWQGDRLWQAVERANSHRQSDKKDDVEPLAPLYQDTD